MNQVTKINWKQVILNWVMLIAVVIVMIFVFLIGGYWLNNHLKDDIKSPNEATQKAQESIKKQDSIQRMIDIKNAQLINNQKQIDSLKNGYEKLKNKPLPNHLRTATVSELDSFWDNYKPDW